MTSFAAIITQSEPDLVQAELSTMLSAMAPTPGHRLGKHLSPKLGLAVAWVEPPSGANSASPAWNDERTLLLLLCGEAFLDKSVSARSGGQAGRTSVQRLILKLYEELGQDFLLHLSGAFSGVLIDERKGTGLVFNDRHGLSRVYVSEGQRRTLFASEAKALLKVAPELRQLDLQGFGEYLTCGCCLEGRTLFRGIKQASPASAWSVAAGSVAGKWNYCDPAQWEKQEVLPHEDFYQQLRETFPRVLKKYVNGPEPVGMSLTGGLDGRMIMAWADRQPGALPCYSFGSSFRDCTDVRIARQVAEMCGQRHETITVGEEFLKQFPELARKSIYVSDGSMDVTGSAELYVNGIARHIAPVRLTGNYGSEIVRGNIAFKPKQLNAEVFSDEVLALNREATETYQRQRAGHLLSFIAFKQVPWHHHSRFSIERSELAPRSPFLDSELVQLMYRCPEDWLTSKEPTFRLIKDGNAALSGVPTDRGLVYPPKRNLRHIYEEFTFKAEYAFDYGMPQWLARANGLLSLIGLERGLLGRHKFCHFRVWYRDSLAEYVKSVLLDPATLGRSFYRRDWLEKQLSAHFRNERNFTSEIHQLLSSELIQRELIGMR